MVHGPIYGRFMGFYVNGFLSISVYKGKPLYREKTAYIKTHKTAINRHGGPHKKDVTHILSKVSFFY